MTRLDMITAARDRLFLLVAEGVGVLRRGYAGVVVSVVLLAAGLAAVVLWVAPSGGQHAAVSAGSPAGGAVSVGPEARFLAGQPGASGPSSGSPAGPAAASGSATPRPRPSVTVSPSTTAARATLAGRVRPGVTYRGKATFYNIGDGGGACLFGPTADVMIGAMNETDYETARACGAYVQVRVAGGASVTVRITNLCPLPCAPGQIDLSPQAFAKLADRARGEVPITWKLLSPATSGTISIRYKTGSSRSWCGVQVINHRNPVARLELRAGNGWRRLPRTGYNYFLAADGGGCGGAIRVTDIYGQQLTLTGVALAPDVAQPTRVQFARH